MTAALSPDLLERANKALAKAKIELMVKPEAMFYATVCLSLEQVWSDYNKTAWTDGTTCGYHPQFFLDCTEAERVGLILHETLHVAYLHMLRGKGFDQERFNKAADYVINLIIIDAGFDLPKCGLYDPCYRGLSVEEVYRMLPAQQQPDPDFMLDLREPTDDVEQQEIQKKLDEILIQAVIQTRAAEEKSAGLIPGEILRYVDRLVNPIIPWHKHLARYMTQFQKTDYSFRRPNRRFQPDHYLPTQHSEAIADVLEYGDLSGSVTQEETDAYLSEAWALLKNLRPRSMKFIGFDTKLRDPIELAHLSDIRKAKIKGGGGTNIIPVLKDIAERKPTFAIIFSDGHFGKRWTSQANNPRIPIIWVIVNNKKFNAPFGKVIHYNTQEKG